MNLDLERRRGENNREAPAAARVPRGDSASMATQPLRTGNGDLIERLSALSDSELAEVFYAAVARREPSGLDDWQSHLVIGEAERIGQGPWEVDFLAPAIEEAADPDRVVCRETTCSRCRTRVRSWARVARCPICARTVYCH